MVDGGFDHSKIIDRFTDKHLVDISCPGSSWPSLSEKPPQHIFANGTSGLILHYPCLSMCVTCAGVPDNGHAHIVMLEYLLQYRSDEYSNIAKRSNRGLTLEKNGYIHLANMFLQQTIDMDYLKFKIYLVNIGRLM